MKPKTKKPETILQTLNKRKWRVKATNLEEGKYLTK